MGLHKSRRSWCKTLAVLDVILAFSSEMNQEINYNGDHNTKKKNRNKIHTLGKNASVLFSHCPLQVCWSQQSEASSKEKVVFRMRNVASDLVVKENAAVASPRVSSLRHLHCVAIKGSCTSISLKLLKERVGSRPKVLSVLSNLPT